MTPGDLYIDNFDGEMICLIRQTSSTRCDACIVRVRRDAWNVGVAHLEPIGCIRNRDFSTLRQWKRIA